MLGNKYRENIFCLAYPAVEMVAAVLGSAAGEKVLIPNDKPVVDGERETAPARPVMKGIHLAPISKAKQYPGQRWKTSGFLRSYSMLHGAACGSSMVSGAFFPSFNPTLMRIGITSSESSTQKLSSLCTLPSGHRNLLVWYQSRCSRICTKQVLPLLLN